MGIFETIKTFFSDEKKGEEHECIVRETFKARYEYFRTLLSANKRALVGMASLEEAMRNERFLSMQFVQATSADILENVLLMVQQVNALSGNLHAELLPRYREIEQCIHAILAPKDQVKEVPFVLSLKETDFSLSAEVGGKMASLGEAFRYLGKNIPEGFVVTASGYRRFLQYNSLQDEITASIQAADLSSLDAVFALSASLQERILAAPVPDDLAEAILARATAIQHAMPNAHFAMRSSAIGEDSHGASYAGQYHSELNVAPEHVLRVYKEIVAGKYSITAMTYRQHQTIADDEIPMCVGCLVMVGACAGGVVYSADPLHATTDVAVNAVPGLPKSVVDGTGEVDVFFVSREQPYTITQRSVAVKRSKLVSAPGEGITEVALSPAEGALPSLTDEQVLEVGSVALEFEKFYGRAQDVEWAYTQDGRLIILQTRALPDADIIVSRADAPAGAVVVADGGVAAAPGVGAGKVFFVRRNEDMLLFPAGAVLVVEQAHARWAPVLSRASAIVSEYGGAAGHLASVAREYGIPALFGIDHAMQRLAGQAVVTVDADAQRVYAGAIPELLERKQKKRAPVEVSPAHTILAAVAQQIVPLHLLNPAAEDFAPLHCRTLHDITRYCHEKAVEEMFHFDSNVFAEQCGKQLTYKGGKLQYFVINIDEGFCAPVTGKYVDISNICSVPTQALWQGMIAIPWAGPPILSGRGFFSIVAESAGNPELEITSASTRMTRNYVMVDKNYCNLQASFGFHFCTVEAHVGEEEQENYVSFHFKGGAANLQRRQQRVAAIADVLAENGFILDLKEDALSARAEDLSMDEALDLLRILGFLLIHSRQMDAVLEGEASRVAFADVLRKGIARLMTEFVPT